ncbi:hypothetical protein BCR42DRAFT_328236 [Absidia repens]|uniref:Tag1-like fifth Ig-like domain-containing protein n=1 Tax=Absidia repens TaxID=90262 RepID=A0A1X2IGB9_9FUNG|nr:hypothetical protein BCR42DRAFT_328236 [Absidia repens]
MERFLSLYLHGNTSVVHVRGSTFGPDDEIHHDTTATATEITTFGSKVPDWLQKALASMTLSIPFPGTTHHDIIQSLTMDNIKIDFSMISGGPVVSGDATALLQLPKEMQFDLDVTEIDPDVYIYLEHDSASPFARLRPRKPCPSKTIHRGDPDGDDGSIPEGMFMVKSSIDKAPFQVLSGHEGEFEKFLDRVFKKRNSTVYLQGTADAMVVSEFGKLTVRDLAFKGQINTMGMQGMTNPPPKVISMAIVKGHPDALQAKTKLIITNPSDVDVNLGTITLAMLYKDIEIGNVTIQDLNLVHRSDNEFESNSYIYAKAGRQRGMCYNDGIQLSPVVEFIGNYISGESTDLVIAGRKGSTKSRLLASLMKQMVFSIQVPTFDEQPLLQDVQMNLLSSTAVAWLRNPFEDIDMQIVNINASATYQSQKIGTMYANFTDGGRGWKGPVELPPVSCQDSIEMNNNNDSEDDDCVGFVVETPRIPVMMKTVGLDMISKALGGKIEVAVDSRVTVMIDSFILADLQYKRNNITAIIKKSF